MARIDTFPLPRRSVLAGAGAAVLGVATASALAGTARAAVTANGVDYSWSHPSITALRQGGYTFACRYLSWDQTKNLTPEEASSLAAAGIAVVCNWESTKGGALNGQAQGVADAREAQRQVAVCGQPAGRPIYFSVDVDAQTTDQPALDAYFDGVASVIGRSRTGAYGGYGVIKRLLDAGKIAWAWQTCTWSNGLWDPRAQLRQVQVNGTLDGVPCDFDQAQVADFGQWTTGQSGTAVTAVVGSNEVITLSDGRIALYTVRGDGNVWGKCQAQPGGTFSLWQQLSSGGGYQGRVAVLRDSADRIALYVRRGSGVYGASQASAGDSFSGWIAIGGAAPVAADPTAVYGSGGIIALYTTGSDGNVWGVNQVAAGGSWGSWQQLSTGGGFAGVPAAVADGSSRIALYVRRSGTVYGASQATAGGSFGGWITIGGGTAVAGDPAAVYGYGGVIALYATGPDGNVWGVNQVAAGGSWGSWQQLSTGGGFAGRSASIVDGDARIALYLRRAGTVYGTNQVSAGGAFGGWVPIGTNGAGITGDPGVVHGPGGILAIYAKTSADNESGVCQSAPGGSFGSWVQV
jgi:hypothetical protein